MVFHEFPLPGEIQSTISSIFLLTFKIIKKKTKEKKKKKKNLKKKKIKKKIFICFLSGKMVKGRSPRTVSKKRSRVNSDSEDEVATNKKKEETTENNDVKGLFETFTTWRKKVRESCINWKAFFVDNPLLSG